MLESNFQMCCRQIHTYSAKAKQTETIFVEISKHFQPFLLLPLSLQLKTLKSYTINNVVQKKRHKYFSSSSSFFLLQLQSIGVTEFIIQQGREEFEKIRTILLPSSSSTYLHSLVKSVDGIIQNRGKWWKREANPNSLFLHFHLKWYFQHEILHCWIDISN